MNGSKELEGLQGESSVYKSMIIGKKVVLPEYMFLAWLTRAIVLPLVLVTVVIDGIKFIVDNLADPLIGLILHLDYNID